MEGYQWGGGGERGGKDARIKKHNWQVQNRQGDVKKSIGNGDAKEHKGMPHGHELKERDGWREGGTRERGQRGKNGTTIIA